MQNSNFKYTRYRKNNSRCIIWPNVKPEAVTFLEDSNAGKLQHRIMERMLIGCNMSNQLIHWTSLKLKITLYERY